jgi:hypothetical protein
LPRQSPEVLGECGLIPLSIASECTGISVPTLRKMCDAGTLRSLNVSTTKKRKEYRIPIKHFIDFLIQSDIELNEKITEIYVIYENRSFPKRSVVKKEEKKDQHDPAHSNCM